MWNRISHISGYPRAFDGSRTYRITCDTVEIRNEIEPILDTINFLPKGYYFELVEVVEEYVAKICKSEPEAAGQEQERKDDLLKFLRYLKSNVLVDGLAFSPEHLVDKYLNSQKP